MSDTFFTHEELDEAYRVADRSQPHLRANMISSIDGAATSGGLSGGLNGPADKEVFDHLRLLADVIIVGAGTVRAEGYGAMRLSEEDARWREQHDLAPHPVFAIVTRSAALDPNLAVFADAPVRPLILTTESAPHARCERLAEVAEIVRCGKEEFDPRAMRAALAERGLNQMLTEGGPHLLGSFAEAGIVDEICLTISPILEGGSAMRITRKSAEVHQPMRLTSVLQASGMLLLRYQR